MFFPDVRQMIPLLNMSKLDVFSPELMHFFLQDKNCACKMSTQSHKVTPALSHSDDAHVFIMCVKLCIEIIYRSSYSYYFTIVHSYNAARQTPSVIISFQYCCT